MREPRRIHVIRFAAMLCLAQSFRAPAATINVPADQSTIQAAINAAFSNLDAIVVAPGTYNECINFLGKAITLRSSGGLAVTTIDGTGLNCSVVQCITGEGLDTILDGFTITGGNAPLGGGMHCENTSPAVNDCIFTGNFASDRGGGMFNLNSSPTITNCTFSNNHATFMSGGLHNESNSSPIITKCNFRDNLCDDDGGGMRNYIDCHPIITNCAFINNVALDEGGAMGNRKNSNPTIINCVFLGNSAPGGAAGMDNHVGNVTPTGAPEIVNCLFAGNFGTGMRNNDPPPVVTNCTFTGNLGAGMFNRLGAAPVVTNCILWGNGGGSFEGNSTPVVNFSDIQGGFAGTGNIDAEPLFADPDGPDNDPLTLEDNDYRLSAGSPCIDTGQNTALPSGTTVDLDGNPRFVDDPNASDCPQTAGTCGTPPIVDMGAYEFVIDCDSCVCPHTCGDIDGNTTIDLLDFAFFAGCFGQHNPATQNCICSDLDGNQAINLLDFALFAEVFGGSSTSTPPNCL